MRTLDLLRRKKAQLVALAAAHGARNIRIFGSVARGEESVNSDVDLLVEMEEGRSLYDLVGLQLDIEELLGKKADVLTEGGINRYLRERILAEARPL